MEPKKTENASEFLSIHLISVVFDSELTVFLLHIVLLFVVVVFVVFVEWQCENMPKKDDKE